MSKVQIKTSEFAAISLRYDAPSWNIYYEGPLNQYPLLRFCFKEAAEQERERIEMRLYQFRQFDHARVSLDDLISHSKITLDMFDVPTQDAADRAYDEAKSELTSARLLLDTVSAEYKDAITRLTKAHMAFVEAELGRRSVNEGH